MTDSWWKWLVKKALHPKVVFCQMAICDLLWMCIWQGWGTLWPCQGQCSTEHVSATDANTAAEVLQHGHILITICAITFIIHCTFQWSTQQGHRVNMESIISGGSWHCEMPGLQSHYLTLRYFNVHKPITILVDSCLKERSWCHLTPRWPPSCLCLKSPRTCRTVLSQDRAWNACMHLWYRMVPHMFLGLDSASRVTTSHSSRLSRRTWQMHQSTFRECCSACRTMMSPSNSTLLRRCW